MKELERIRYLATALEIPLRFMRLNNSLQLLKDTEPIAARDGAELYIETIPQRIPFAYGNGYSRTIITISVDGKIYRLEQKRLAEFLERIVQSSKMEDASE